MQFYLFNIRLRNSITGSDENYASHCLSTEEHAYVIFGMQFVRR